MEVRFATRILERCYADSAMALRRFGQTIGRKYILRINIIKYAKSLAELMDLPGLNCHALKGDREGDHAITLTAQMRLIVRIVENVVTVREVSKHYDKR